MKNNFNVASFRKDHKTSGANRLCENSILSDVILNEVKNLKQILGLFISFRVTDRLFTQSASSLETSTTLHWETGNGKVIEDVKFISSLGKASFDSSHKFRALHEGRIYDAPRHSIIPIASR